MFGDYWEQSRDEEEPSSEDDVTIEVGMIHQAQKNSQMQSLEMQLELIMNTVRQHGSDQTSVVSIGSIQAALLKERAQLELHMREQFEHRESARATRRRMQNTYGTTIKIKAGEPLEYER